MSKNLFNIFILAFICTVVLSMFGFSNKISESEQTLSFLDSEAMKSHNEPSQLNKQEKRILPTPDFANVKYGTHKRNVFDLWLANSDSPTPLVVYFHGGGFRGGDKGSVNLELLQKLLKGGVSVAAVNYRLSDTAPFPAQMHDGARALQFIRYYAVKYNIDPKRIGATGGSAGAGISLWLAFHDDLSNSSSPDSITHRSTRLTAVAVGAAQTSYDPRFIMKLFNTNQVHEALIAFFGMDKAIDVDNAKFHLLFEQASPINYVTKDDPPVMLFFSQKNEPLLPNSTGRQHIHHPKFGFVLKEKLEILGIECIIKLIEDYPQDMERRGYNTDFVKFFFKKFGMKSNK